MFSMAFRMLMLSSAMAFCVRMSRFRFYGLCSVCQRVAYFSSLGFPWCQVTRRCDRYQSRPLVLFP